MTSSGTNDEPATRAPGSDRSTILKLAAGLLVGGFLLNFVVTAFHPSGSEDDHRAIFTKYADSDAWVAIHLAQFIGILIALAGLLVVYRALTVYRRVPVLARFAAGATVVTAGALAVLQAVDGVALKQAVDAWTDASGSQKAIRFDNAETLRWIEWGLQSYFRVLLGLTLVLIGTAIAASRLVAGWLGCVAILAGLLSVAIGIDVGYSGLESRLQDVAGIAFVLALLVFAVGMSVMGVRGRHPVIAAHGQ